MYWILRYGIDSEVQFELRPEALLADCQLPHGCPIEDVTAAIQAALAAPLDFPKLASALVPGDRVVLALEPGVPRSEAIVSAAAQTLRDAGIESDHITVLETSADRKRPIAAEKPAARASHPAGPLRWTHDPDDRNQLSYLANIGEGKPVYLNRAICEADFVIPIGCQWPDAAFHYQSIHDGLFPSFADQDALQRYRSPVAADSPVQRKRLRKQATEVGWLLGAMFALRVVPGPGDSILGVLAGDVQAVDRRAQELNTAAWKVQVPARAKLVVAAIEGGAERQTWQNLGRALHAARQAVADGGAIAVCCDLQDALGPALQVLISADSPDDARREIVHERLSDALVASELIHALNNGRIYLLSRLPPEQVESLGVAPVGSAAELVRLAARHENCILLGNAPHAIVSVSDE